MLTKIKLFYQIRKFYKIYGTELGSNFINTLSDITNNNLHDVLFDINEVLKANSTCFFREAYELDVWLNKLKAQIKAYRCRKPMQIVSKILAVLGIISTLWITFSFAEVVCKNTDPNAEYSDLNLLRAFANIRTDVGVYHNDGTIITADGHIWEYTTNLSDGTLVKVTFDDNNTSDVTDDTINNVREVQ